MVGVTHGERFLRIKCRETVAPPQCASIESTDWQAALAQLPTASTGYPAVIDGRALQAPVGGVLAAVLDAARAFCSSHARQASLTLLLPTAPADADWSLAGDAAAARMALATLAAEWGALGLRINALSATCAPAECVPLLDYMSGARAQFLTGQVLMPALP